MFQTSPASAGLGKLGLEPSAGTQGRSADSADGFSQEFDKQVQKINGKEGAENGAGPESAAPKPDRDETTADKQRAGSSNGQGEDTRQAQQESQGGVQGGKALPQPVAGLPPQLVELRDETPADEESGIESLEQDIAGAEGVEALAIAVSEEEVPTQPFAFAPVGVAVPEESAAVDETPAGGEDEIPTLRLRDVLSQRFAAMNSGKGAEPGLGKEGKFELQSLLPGQPLPLRSLTATEGAGVTAPVLAATSAVPQGSVSSLPVSMTLALPLQQKGWDQAMGERVVWMARSNIQEAQLQLNPRELGPIEIKIALKQEQAHVQFVAHHATTRDALEAAMPRLREMFNESGLNLTQSDVSQHSFRDGERNSPAGTAAGTAPAGEGLGAEEVEESVAARHVGLANPRGIDYFA